MMVCSTNDNSLREHLLHEFQLITLPKAISAGHATEETHKHDSKILKSNETIDLNRFQNNQNLKSNIFLSCRDN